MIDNSTDKFIHRYTPVRGKVCSVANAITNKEDNVTSLAVHT